MNRKALGRVLCNRSHTISRFLSRQKHNQGYSQAATCGLCLPEACMNEGEMKWISRLWTLKDDCGAIILMTRSQPPFSSSLGAIRPNTHMILTHLNEANHLATHCSGKISNMCKKMTLLYLTTVAAKDRRVATAVTFPVVVIMWWTFKLKLDLLDLVFHISVGPGSLSGSIKAFLKTPKLMEVQNKITRLLVL